MISRRRQSRVLSHDRGIMAIRYAAMSARPESDDGRQCAVD